METAWADRREPGPLDVVLAGMVDALGYYFDRRGLWQLGDRWNERAIALRRGSGIPQDESALAHELYRRACLLHIRGQYKEAVQLLRESLQLIEKAANLQGQAASLHQLAIIENAQGNPAEVRRLLQQSLGIKGATRRLKRPVRLAARAGDHRACPGQPGRARGCPAVPGINELVGDLSGHLRLAARAGDHRA